MLRALTREWKNVLRKRSPKKKKEKGKKTKKDGRREKKETICNETRAVRRDYGIVMRGEER